MKKVNRFTILIIGAILLAATPVMAQVNSDLPSTPQSQIIKEPDWLFETNQVADISVINHRQMMVSSGCDVNGDGYEDLLIGDRDYDYLYPRDDNERAWLFLGSDSGLSDTPSVIFNPPYANYYGFFGTQVACAGDVNGDGYEDLLIGMDNYESAYSDEGAVFVYYGSPTGPSSTYSWMARGNSQWAHFGLSLDSAGDVNNDGYDDIIVGTLENYLLAVPHAYVWYGGAGGLGSPGLPSNADWVGYGPTPGQIQGNYYGEYVHGIGDVNGDTFDDVMVSAHLYDSGVNDQGAVFVYHGSATGLVSPGTIENASWMATSGQTLSIFGYSGDGVGDLNGDGYDDLAIGAYGFDNPEVNEGKVFVWYGSISGLGVNGNPGNADWSAEANVPSYLSFVVRSAGDVNNDGFADLLVTAPVYPVVSGDETLNSAGAWFVWNGSVDGLGENGTAANADFAGYGDQTGGGLGRDDAGAADVNHDNLDDIFVAAWLYDNPQTDEGVVVGYLSSIKTYLPLVLRAP